MLVIVAQAWRSIRTDQVIGDWSDHTTILASLGGNSRGSYTDPLGPDASMAFYSFFMNHPMPKPTVPKVKSSLASRWRKVLRRLRELFPPNDLSG